jgi:hypothetical protein
MGWVATRGPPTVFTPSSRQAAISASAASVSTKAVASRRRCRASLKATTQYALSTKDLFTRTRFVEKQTKNKNKKNVNDCGPLSEKRTQSAEAPGPKACGAQLAGPLILTEQMNQTQPPPTPSKSPGGTLFMCLSYSPRRTSLLRGVLFRFRRLLAAGKHPTHPLVAN